jgi:TetR/AcrR family transcriptional repressor of lmrAB and yxaGH operons
MAQDTRARMIETAARLLQHRGYYGTALSDILEESGAPRGSLYFHFPDGKDQLVIEATRASVAIATRELEETLAHAKTPGAGVRAYAEAAARILRETDFAFGCPVAPVILDAAGGVEELARICKAAFEEWGRLLQDCFVQAGIPARRARSLALLSIAAIEGLLLIARAYRDCAPMLQAATELEPLVNAALPKKRRAA